MHAWQDAIARGALDDELSRMAGDMKAANEHYKGQAKHVKLHLPASGGAAAKAKAKAKSRA